MRRLLPALVLVLSAPPAARADDPSDPNVIVARAVKATGWRNDGKPVRLSWKGEGTIHLAGGKVPFSAEWWFRAPDALRGEAVVEVGGEKGKYTHVINGDKVWDSRGGETEEVTGEKNELSRHEAYKTWVSTLTPLTRDKEFKLAAAGEKDVGGKPAVGVRVERAGHPAVTLYFDKASRLPVKIEERVKDEGRDRKEVTEETFFEDWKDVGGRKVFGKVRVGRDGKPLLEATLSDQKTPATLDPKLFEKP